MAERIDRQNIIYFYVGARPASRIEDGYDVISDWPPCGNHSAEKAQLRLCIPSPDLVAEPDIGIQHVPSVAGVEEAIARSAAAVLEQAQQQVIPGVMAEVRQISDGFRAENRALTERVEQQQATITRLQEQLKETNQRLAAVLARIDPQGNDG